MVTYLDRYDLFVFDLDGTLADTREDLADSLNETLRRLGRPPLNVATVTSYVGEGVQLLLQRALGSHGTPQDIDRAVAEFLAVYTAGCTRKTSLYCGVREALRGLAMKDLAVLTNKPFACTRKILAHLGVERLFRRIDGGDTAAARKPDPAGLRDLARSLGHLLSRTLLVGDSSTDILTARAAGAASAFVTYGFRPEAWKETPPDHKIPSLLALLGPISL